MAETLRLRFFDSSKHGRHGSALVSPVGFEPTLGPYETATSLVLRPILRQTPPGAKFLRLVPFLRGRPRKICPRSVECPCMNYAALTSAHRRA